MPDRLHAANALEDLRFDLRLAIWLGLGEQRAELRLRVCPVRSKHERVERRASAQNARVELDGFVPQVGRDLAAAGLCTHEWAGQRAYTEEPCVPRTKRTNSVARATRSIGSPPARTVGQRGGHSEQICSVAASELEDTATLAPRAG